MISCKIEFENFNFIAEVDVLVFVYVPMETIPKNFMIKAKGVRCFLRSLT